MTASSLGRADENEVRSMSVESNGPDDKNNVCYIIFLMYGMGVLLPWNVILSSLDFLID